MDRDRLRPPSVDAVLALVRPRLVEGTEPSAVTVLAREVQAEERERLSSGVPARTLESLADAVLDRLEVLGGAGDADAGPVPVINATGVLVHTNLGRAAWPRAAVEAAVRAAAEPVLLELDRESGRRGPRFREAEEHLIALTGAEDALITNNNAAAVALAVGLARRRGVLVSRGELIEIGGGVRIPEIVRRAGARLIEVGTTNRTRVDDFAAVLAEGPASLVLRVHRSNFRQEGFVEEPDMVELARVAREHGVPLVDDLGSGALIDTAAYGLAHEPTPRERLAAGADLVTFSGDKLLGGPQAGLVAGRADLVARLRHDPLARAMRPDKVTLAAMAATLAIYRAGRATLDVPVWRAIAADADRLRERAEAILDQLPDRAGVDTIESVATVGGGALPGETLPSAALRIVGHAASRLLARLRQGDPSVIARAESGAVVLDLRSVDPSADRALGMAMARAIEDRPGVATGSAAHP